MDRRGGNHRTPSPGHPLQHGYQLEDAPYGQAPQPINDPYGRAPQQHDGPYAQMPPHRPDAYTPSNLEPPFASQQRLGTPSDHLALNAPVSCLVRYPTQQRLTILSNPLITSPATTT
jgi:hypothetical protein